jgi:hypothetical protein
MRSTPEAAALAAELMARFAERTGLSDPDRPPRRYLWTDAFAVCNFLGLGSTGSALRLVEQVHRVLGRHRPDDARSGWLSGLSDEEAAAHPTRGGLRIGKELPERAPREKFDPELEWHRDGQYFHYLTRWMHALDQLSRHSGDPTGNRWARELAETAFSAFSYIPFPGAPRRMAWKLSIDLSRALVPSMGQHDPLDGLITFRVLRAHRPAPGDPGLTWEIQELELMAKRLEWRTDDPLGLGGLLSDALRVGQLLSESADDGALLAPLLDAAGWGLDSLLRERPFDRPAAHRLAFRELGLSIGLHAAERLAALLAPAELLPGVERLLEHAGLGERIEHFWLEPRQQRSAGWLAHEDINAVMLATSLTPAGYLGLEVARA